MSETLNDLVSAAVELVPRLAGAVAVLLAALLVALLVQRLATRALEHLGLDQLFERTGASNAIWQLGYSGGPSRLLGLVVFWSVMLAGFASVLSILGLSSLENSMSQIANLSGRLLVALVIVILGAISAGWLADLVGRRAEEAGLRGTNAFRRAVFGTVIAISTLLAASQLGLETSLLVTLAIVVLATIGLAAAIAIGQGLVKLSGNVAASRYVQEGIEEGDVISVNGIEGSVEQLGYASITLRSEDGDLYQIPNNVLLENIVRKRG